MSRIRRTVVAVLLVVSACSGASFEEDFISVDESAPEALAAEAPAEPTPGPTETPEPAPTVSPTPEPTPTATPPPTATPVPVAATPCVDGMAGEYPCDGVGLEAFLSIAGLGGSTTDIVSDLWGWTNPATGAEIVIVGMSRHTAFVDITLPASPVVLGVLAHANGLSSPVNDMKVYANHVFIVGDSPGFGLLVFDLMALPETGSPDIELDPLTHFVDADQTHNLAVDTSTGFAFLARGTTCLGGLRIMDIGDPSAPEFAGCVDGSSVHDAQCVVYTGPDEDHVGRELCIGSDESALDIIDVTDKESPAVISSTIYPGVSYTHQAWLTEDQTYLLVGDEFDEFASGGNTRTLIFDVSDLDAPVLTGTHEGPTAAVDHNQFIVGNYSYQSNYRAGLRIVELTDLANGDLTEVAYFDTYPSSDTPEFSGAFGAYPFFASGVVPVTSIESGLFILRPEPFD